jgi:hypothetical protein
MRGINPGINAQHEHRPYWKRAHHDWRFWVGLFLMLTGIMIYVMTDGFSWRPST